MNIKTFKAFLLILFVSPFINVAFGAQSEDTVSERELLLLAAVSYSNEQQVGSEVKFTSKMIRAYQLSDGIVSQDEVKDWSVLGFDVNDGSSKDGFSIYLFKKGKNIVIAPRGTDGGVLTENWRYLMSAEHPQAKYMEYYIRQLVPVLAKEEGCRIYFCGHSLGGYLALYGTGVLMQYPEMRKHFVKVVTFNGLGLGRGTNMSVLDELYKLKKEQIVNYRINGDAVSYIGDHITLCISLDLVKSPFTRNPHWWNMFPMASAHALVQFFFHEPFLSKSQLEGLCPGDNSDGKRRAADEDRNKDDSYEGKSVVGAPDLTPEKVAVVG